MSELAFNLSGERFDVPASAAFWRVRRLRDVPRGGPEVVFGRDGLPLIIPIDSGTEEFRRYVDDVPGKYRLDPIDERHQAVGGDVPAAYIHVAKAERNASVATVPELRETVTLDPRDELLREIVRVNADITKTMVDRFAGVMEAAAHLLNAADGAGLPARPGMAVVDVETDEDPEGDAARPSFDLGAVIGQVVPALCMAAGARGVDLSKVGALFGGKASGAQPEAESPITSDGTKPAAPRGGGSKRLEAGTAERAAASEAQPKAADPIAHFFAIQGQLSLEERAFVQGVISGLPATELAQWREQLTQMSVDDAVALIRREIAKGKENAS